MSAGTPVICSNTSSLPEVGGDAVEYISPYDSKELAERISYVCGSSTIRAVMKAKGLIQAKKFSWELTAQKTNKLYNEIYEG